MVICEILGVYLVDFKDNEGGRNVWKTLWFSIKQDIW